MANTNVTQPSFSSGIISTELFARIDFSKIASGLKQCKNWVIRPAGGAVYRVGTRYIAETKFPLKEVSLIPFVYNRKNGFCLEFGDGYIRFFKNGEIVESGNVPYEVKTIYKDYEVRDIKYSQNKNKLYLVHPNHAPAILERISDDNWVLKDMKFNPDVPVVTNVKIVKGKTNGSTATPVIYDDWQYAVSVLDKDGNESLPVYSNKLSSDIDLLKNNIKLTFNRPSVFKDVDKFLIYRIKGGKFFLCYTLPYEDKASFEFNDISFALDETKNPKKAFTEFTDGNYPSAVGFWQQRLVLANTKKKPSTFWMSRIGSPDDFSTTDYESADDAIELTFNSGTTDAIVDLIPMDDLIVFTEGKIWRVTGTSVKTMNAFIESYSGSSKLKPFATKKSVLYVDSSENTVSNFVYSYELNGYSGQNLDILSRELMDGYKIKDISYRNTPYGVMYSVRSDGTLLGLTYLREENIYAWHEHTTKDGKFENVCSIDKDTNDDVYVVVERNKQRYIEIFGNYIDNTQGINDSWHLDCSTKKIGDLREYENTKEETRSILYRAFSLSENNNWDCYNLILAGDIPTSLFIYKQKGNDAWWSKDGFKVAKTKRELKKTKFPLGYAAVRFPNNDFKEFLETPIYATEESSGGALYVYKENKMEKIGYNDSYGVNGLVYKRYQYTKNESLNKTITEKDIIKTPLYTVGEPEEGGKAYVDVRLTNFKTISKVEGKDIVVDGLTYIYKKGDISSIEKVSGLERFNGQKVTAVIDTNVYKDLEVTNGELVLPVSGKYVLVGLPYEGILETIPQELKFSSGSSTVGVNRRIYDGTISYYKSRGLWYGSDYNHLYELKPYNQETYSLNIPLETGKRTLKVADGYSNENPFLVVQRSPVPALIQSITLGIKYNDKN